MRTLPQYLRGQKLALFLLLVLLTAGAAQAGLPGAVAVTIVTPQANGIIHESVTVKATVASDFELATVVADLDGTLANMTFAGGEWSATVDMTGASWGDKNLSVTASDVFANQNSTSTVVRFDLPPVITVTTPQDFDVVTTTFPVNATCVDDGPDGCTRVEMRHSNWNVCGTSSTIVANNGPTLNKIANLPFNDHGDRLATCIRGLDSAGQAGVQLTHLWIIDSPFFTEVDEASGQLVDVTEDFLLFTGKVNSGFGEPIGFLDRATGIETAITNDRNTILNRTDARLTPFGFISPVLVFTPGSGWAYQIWDWRANGTLHELGAIQAFSLRTRGPWATWSQRPGGNPELILRDLVTESDQVVFSGLTSGPALEADGSVIFSGEPDFDLARFDGTTITTLVSDFPTRNIEPIADGGSIVYRKSRQIGPTLWEDTIALYKDGVETLLNPFDTSNRKGFELAGDWLAFGRPGTTGQEQVWLRDPDGNETQITFFSAGARVTSVSEGGALVYGTAAGQFLHTPYSTVPINIGGPRDRSFWFNRRLYRTAGRKLFEITIEIFSDGFEDGTTTPWSIVTP